MTDFVSSNLREREANEVRGICQKAITIARRNAKGCSGSNRTGVTLSEQTGDREWKIGVGWCGSCLSSIGVFIIHGNLAYDEQVEVCDRHGRALRHGAQTGDID